MHVHMNQVNPNAQLDAMYAAQKAAAKREAARTRKKLMEFAAEVEGEEEVEGGGVGAAGERGESPEEQEREADGSLSDWA